MATHTKQPEESDLCDFTVDARYETLLDLVFDMAKEWGVDPSDVVKTLAASVEEGDQR